MDTMWLQGLIWVGAGSMLAVFLIRKRGRKARR